MAVTLLGDVSPEVNTLFDSLSNLFQWHSSNAEGGWTGQRWDSEYLAAGIGCNQTEQAHNVVPVLGCPGWTSVVGLELQSWAGSRALPPTSPGPWACYLISLGLILLMCYMEIIPTLWEPL